MKAEFIVRVEVKNDRLTADAGQQYIETLLAEKLVLAVGGLSWVLTTEVVPVTEVA